MVKKRTIVEINGRKYDAVSGQIVSETPTAAPVIDGFQAPIADIATPSTPKSAKKRTVNQATNLHQKPQKTKKLHPSAVKKPAVTHVPKKVQAKSSMVMSPAVTDVRAAKKLGSRPDRAERAQSHAKSEHVKKFHADVQPVQSTTPAVPPEDVVATPDTPPLTEPMPRPVVERPAPQPEPQASPEPQVENSEPKESFIRRVTQKRPKLLPAAMTTVLVLAVGGYVAVQNIPNMALRVAASRAGFNASLPGYSPSGFGFTGPVAYSDGIVELEYQSNSDERTYTLIQKESSWDSQSLLDNFVATASDDYLTFQERGLTVYIYDTSNATWVDGGIWYTLEGNSLLTSEQLLKIASSL